MSFPFFFRYVIIGRSTHININQDNFILNQHNNYTTHLDCNSLSKTKTAKNKEINFFDIQRHYYSDSNCRQNKNKMVYKANMERLITY